MQSIGLVHERERKKAHKEISKKSERESEVETTKNPPARKAKQLIQSLQVKAYFSKIYIEKDTQDRGRFDSKSGITERI
jgi:hypothetical protein